MLGKWLREWQEAGGSSWLHQAQLQPLQYSSVHGWSRACWGSARPFLKKGSVALASHSTDRGKTGTKRHLLTNRHGLRLTFLLMYVNAHDGVPLTQLLNAVTPVKCSRTQAPCREIKNVVCGCAVRLQAQLR